ncbi:MAG: hypothetical protein Q9190_001264 [Brigantiaea leucoxantha]
MGSILAQSPAIGGLAGQIANNAYLLEQSIGLEGPFLGDQVAIHTAASGDEAIQRARLEIIDQCRSLLSLVAGPSEMLKNMVLIDKHNLITLQIINHFDIANKVPLDGSISQRELAQACELPQDILTRVLRQAMTYHVFYEPQPGYIAHTEVSKVIPSLSPLLSYQLEICLPSTTNLLKALKDEQKRCAFQIAHGTSDTWWDYAEKSERWTEEYGKYQALITQGGAHDVSHVVNGYDWGKLGQATVVDIGGADGFVATAVASKFPSLDISVQDSPNLASAFASKLPPSLASRVSFTPHSFFEPQPASSKSADVFFLRHILHDWPEAECLQILRHLTDVMKSGARLVVAEQVLPPIGSVSNHTERVMRGLDMQMLVQFGSQERTAGDWEALFDKASGGRLKITGMEKPKGSADTLMEVVLV